MVEKFNQRFEEEKKSQKSIDKKQENSKFLETQKTKLFFSSALSSLKSFFESEKSISKEYKEELDQFSEATSQELKKLKKTFSTNKKRTYYPAVQDRLPEIQDLIVQNANEVNSFIDKTKNDSNLIARLMANIADRIFKS